MIMVGDCADCSDGLCTMNCSSAVMTTNAEHISASIWCGSFPAKATSAQLRNFQMARQAGDCIHYGIPPALSGTGDRPAASCTCLHGRDHDGSEFGPCSYCEDRPDALCADCGDGVYAEELSTEGWERYGALLCPECLSTRITDDHDEQDETALSSQAGVG